MKTFHYITKDGEGWIKLENPYRRYLSYYGGILHDEHELHDKFEYANPPLKWVGDKLPEGTVLREEEIEPVYTMQDFEGNPFTITEAEYEKWKLFNHVSKAARLKSQLTQREGEPEKHMCINCDAFEVDAPKRFCKICLDNLHAQGLTARYENATTREQGEAEQRSSSSKVRKYERMLSGTPKDSEGESRVIGHFEYDLKEGTEKFTPISSQPVTEPVKGEEAAAIDVLKRYTNIDHEGNVSTHSSVILGAMEKFKALTPLQPNEKGETYTRSEVEGLLNKFCNEVMVGQSVGTIPKHSNGIAQYIIDNF